MSKRLWLAVLLQALTDAIKTGDYKYFDTRNPEFLSVCSLAGKSPKIFIRSINRIIGDPKELAKLRKRTDCKVAGTDYADLLEYSGDNLADYDNLFEEMFSR